MKLYNAKSFRNDYLYKTVALVLSLLVFYLIIPNLKIFNPISLFSIIAHARHEVTGNLGGHGVLPPPVLTAIQGLREMSSTEYSLTGKFKNDPLLSQRMVEGAWPIRQKRSSQIVVVFQQEIDDTCISIWDRNGIVLAHCHR